ncbi:MAG: DnaD domain protein [Ruminococcaceae bacterium]|nr:DnaD domain protein [Oscillospiraceae bacterium]
MRYLINFGSSVLALPKKTVLEKLGVASEKELKTLILLSSLEDSVEELETQAEAIGISKSELDSALSFWKGAGVISAVDSRPEKQLVKKVARHADAPNYSGEELARIIEENGLSYVIDECQHIMGKVFNMTEINRIAALGSYLGLSGDYILTLFSYCAEHDKASLKYAEKMAYNLYDRGINTSEALDEYIRAEEQKRSLENKLRTIFGWGSRALTPTEKKYITQWCDEYSYTADIITEAYNITVENTGKPALPYLSKILANWYSKGYKTLDDVNRAMNEYERNKEEKKNAENKGSFDVDEFFEIALKRSREKMSSYNGG